METEKASQTLPVQGTHSRFQRFPLMNNHSAVPSHQEGEGGLNIGQITSTLRRRLPIIFGVTTVVSSGALLKTMTSKPTYQADFEILTKPVTVETQVLSSVPQTLSNREQQKQATPEQVLDDTELKLLKSPRVLNPIVKALKPKYPDLTYEVLASKLEVVPVPKSKILSVGFQDESPEKVQAVLKLVSQAYLKYSLDERLADVQQGIEFVDQQLPQLQNRVETLQDKLQNFRQQYNLIDPDSAGKELSGHTSTIGQQRLEAEVKLAEAQSLAQDLTQQQRSGSDDPASTALRENTRYQTLLNQLLDVETQVAKSSGIFTEKAPQIQNLRSQLENLQPLLQKEGRRTENEVASRVRELESRKAVLAQTEEFLKQRVRQLSVISRQYNDIQQDLKIATDNLNQFLTKREALRLDAGQRKAPWQILTPPTKPTPSAGNIQQTGILGAVLGLLLGVGTVLLLEKLSNVLRTPEEVKDATKLPLLGVIPFDPAVELGRISFAEPVPMPELVGVVNQVRQKMGSKHSKNYLNGSSRFLEAFRSLHTNIRLLSPDDLVRSLVISSPSPEEGKSTLAIYLAQAAAALGQRVLLVDTDLRCPRLHEKLQIPNTYGLSSVVTSDVEFEQAIQSYPGEPNLCILTAGQTPPDPTRLLSSKKMQNLMRQFEEAYDLVIYDTPPLLGLADAKLIAAKTDGIVLTVGLDKTKNAAISQALEELKVSSVVPLGIVANGFKES
jgi:capsular exopolysaccharide synthesis family protein